MNDAMIERLKKLAATVCFADFEEGTAIVHDNCGGNVDVAYEMGERSGEVMLARDVLISLGIGWR